MIAPEPTRGKSFTGTRQRFRRGKFAPQKAARAVGAREAAAFLTSGITVLLAESYCGPISVKHAPSWVAR
jgi:hypothetical protein